MIRISEYLRMAVLNKIKAVFKKQGYQIISARYVSHQMFWDYNITYEVIVRAQE